MTGKPIRAQKGHTGVADLAVSPNGARLATLAYNGTVRLFAAATGDLLQSFETRPLLAARLAFSPDGRQLGTVGAGGSVKLWDVERGQEQLTLRPALFSVFTERPRNACAFSPDGMMLAAGGFGKGNVFSCPARSSARCAATAWRCWRWRTARMARCWRPLATAGR